MRVVIDDMADFIGSRPVSNAVLLSQIEKPEAFAAGFAGTFPHEDIALFCTADAALGRQAFASGGRRVQHPASIEDVLSDPKASLWYFIVRFEREHAGAALRALAEAKLVPVHRQLGADAYAIAIGETRAIRRFADAGWRVETIGNVNLPETHDLYLMRDADMAPAGFAASATEMFGAAGCEVLLDDRHGKVVAIPAGTSIEHLHFPVTHHGHNLKLLPDPALANRFALSDETFGAAHEPGPPRPDDAARICSLLPVTRLSDIVDRLSGRAEVAGGPIRSRHIHHPDCARAIDEMERLFVAAGLQPTRHHFIHEGRQLSNLQADLVGTRQEIVLVTAHLDSRAGRNEPDYRPERDAAPGADDDASGVAAVIAAAHALKEMAKGGAPSRTIRFALFHAEEHGLIGSRYYARAAAAANMPIVGVLQMDMIGFLPGGADRRYEIHLGCRDDRVVERRSEPLAVAVEQAAALLGELGPAEIYRTPSDPTRADPADGRSDHSSFHLSGYPAVIVSENFFGGTVENPTAEPNNLHYHSRTDTGIDAGYATAISRAVALAAWTLARGEVS